MLNLLNKLSVQVTVAIICVLSNAGITYLMFFKALPAQNKEIATLMIGQLQGAITTGIFGWLYSHSKGNSKIQ
jgi:hypothetical protein